MRVSLHPKRALSGTLVACLCLLTAAVPRTGNAQDAQVTKLMAALKITQPNWVLRRLKAGTQSAARTLLPCILG